MAYKSIARRIVESAQDATEAEELARSVPGTDVKHAESGASIEYTFTNDGSVLEIVDGNRAWAYDGGIEVVPDGVEVVADSPDDWDHSR